jgi:hypothetical protein
LLFSDLSSVSEVGDDRRFIGQTREVLIHGLIELGFHSLTSLLRLLPQGKGILAHDTEVSGSWLGPLWNQKRGRGYYRVMLERAVGEASGEEDRPGLNASTWHYTVCGVDIESDQPIGELRPQAARSSSLIVRWNVEPFPKPGQDWFRQWRLSDNSVFLSFARTEGGYFLRFSDLADFWVAADGSQILCRPEPGIPDYAVRHMLLDQTLPLVLSRRGCAVFHASAVETEHGAIVFSGPSGRGKSTLAGYFGSQGYPLITDDCLALRSSADGIVVLPAYPGVRLLRDSLQFLAPDVPDQPPLTHGKNKHRYGSQEALPFADQAVPLRRFYFLQPPPIDDIEITNVVGAGLIRDVVGGQFLLDSEDPVELEASFQIAAGLARSSLCYRLALPRDLNRLADCTGRIAAHSAGELSSSKESFVDR